MRGALLVGLQARLVGNGESFPDQDVSHVAFKAYEGREGSAIAVGPAGAFDSNRPFEELAQAARSEETLGEFGIAAGLLDFRGVRFDETDALTRQLDRVAVDDADQGAVDRLGDRRSAGHGKKACENEVFHTHRLKQPLPYSGAARG